MSTIVVVFRLGLQQLTQKSLAVMVAATLPFGLMSDSSAQTADSRDVSEHAKRVVSSMYDQFERMDQLSLHSDVVMTFYREIPGADIPLHNPISGSFTYHAMNEMWLKESHLDPSLFPGMNTVIGFDGVFYHYAMPDHGLVSVSMSGDRKPLGMTLPNPIFQMAQFFFPTGDESDDVRLVDLRDAAANPPSPLGGWVVAETANGPVTQAIFAGGIGDGAPYSTRVSIPLNSHHVSSIERLRKDGSVYTRTEFDSYTTLLTENGDTVYLPRSVAFEGFVDGVPAVHADFSISKLITTNLDDKISASFFSPDWSHGGRIWLDDIGEYIR